jgi:hypothetical protein
MRNLAVTYGCHLLGQTERDSSAHSDLQESTEHNYRSLRIVPRSITNWNWNRLTE